MSTTRSDFETWWREEGSAMRPLPDEDVEEFARRITSIAWANGAYAATSLIEPPTTESK